MKKILVVSLAVAAVAGVSYYTFAENGAGQNAMDPGGMPPTAVKTQTIEPQSITLFEELPGRTSAYKVSQIRPQVSGIVTKRQFEEGSIVKEGDQLYQIDPAPFRATYNSALANLQKAKANAKAITAKSDRYAELVKINAVSLQEYDDIKASLDQANADIAVANAAVATAKINLDYTKVMAPISGRISKSSVTEGALVSAGQAEPLATITQLNPIYVDMSQSSTDLMRIRGQIGAEQENPVEIFLNGNNEAYPQKGTLQFSDVSVDETTSAVQLRAIVPNENENLLPGLFVRARLELGTKDAILVPQRATVRAPDGSLSIWTVGADNTANPTPITIDREYKDQWIVTSGLSAGDIIIVEGYQKVGPGSPVSTGDQPEGLVPAPQAPESAAPAPEASETPAETTPDAVNEQPAEQDAAPMAEDTAEPEDMSASGTDAANPAAAADGMTARDLFAAPEVLEEAPGDNQVTAE